MWFSSPFDYAPSGAVPRPTNDPQFLRVDTSDERGIVHMQLQRAPANALTVEMMDEINTWLLYIASEEAAKALVISSACPAMFSAGGDFHEIYHTSKERFTAFWHGQQKLWLILNTYPKPVVAAVNGSCTGAGCTLAISCDARVMAEKQTTSNEDVRRFKIGLHEAKFGLAMPPWGVASYARLLGTRVAERMLVFGELPSAQEALAAGLVDVVTPDSASCVARAFEEAARYLTVSADAHAATRAIARRDLLDHLGTSEKRDRDTVVMVDHMLSERVQKMLGQFMTTVGKK